MASLTQKKMTILSPSASAVVAEQTIEGLIFRHLHNKVNPFNPIGHFPAKNSD
jgi:hypothetical protein